jgi:sugar lactone lactonase YvrE
MEQALYWVDIPRGLMFRFDPATGAAEQVCEAGQQLGGLVVQEDGSLLQFLERGRVQIWRAGEVEVVCDEIPREEGCRFNDAATDPRGRVLAGTMPGPDGTARLYRFDRDGSWELLVDDLGQSNGMEFIAGGTAFYHTDTKAKTISRFEYELTSGSLGERQVVVRVDSGDAVPDGLVVDAAGTLMSAQWGGSAIVCYSDGGAQRGRMEFPTPQVSSLAFGGRDYTDLYVTTAGGDERQRYGPAAGGLFRLPSAVRGCGPPLARVCI